MSIHIQDMPETGTIVFAFMFLAAATLNLGAEIKDAKNLRAFTKPLLMPMLAGIYLLESRTTDLFVVLALLSASAGDAFLILQRRKAFFIMGLVSFLLCHVFYILHFIRESDFPDGIPWYFWFFALPYLLTGTLIFANLRKNLKNLMFPIIIYMTVILFFGFLCAARVYNSRGMEFLLPLAGALLFILSDTLLAFNSFKKRFRSAGFLIMLTYLAAQMLIVAGIIGL